MAEKGARGRWEPMVIDQGALLELRDVAGEPPFLGKKWVIVNLMTGELKWYTSAKRTVARKGRK